MACISQNKLWESEFDNIVSKNYEVQDININQSKLEVHDTYEKDEEKQQTSNRLIMRMKLRKLI